MARSVGSSRGLNQIKRCGGRSKAGGSWQRHEESTEPEDGPQRRSHRAHQYLQPEVGLTWTVRGMLQAAEAA